MPCPYIDIYDIWLIKPNNTFDKETQRAVKAWQTKNRLSPTGYLTQSDYDKLLAEYAKKEKDLFKIFDDSRFKEGGNDGLNKKLNYWLDNTIGDNKYTEKLKSQAPDGTELGNYTSKFTSDTSYLINKFQEKYRLDPYYLKKTDKSIDVITRLVLKKEFEKQ